MVSNPFGDVYLQIFQQTMSNNTYAMSFAWTVMFQLSMEEQQNIISTLKSKKKV